MSLRGLLVLIVLLAAAVGALYWAGRAPAPGPPSTLDTPLVPAFTEDAVRGIELTCEGSTVSLRRDASRGWRIVKPVEAEADPRKIRDVVTALQDARVRKVIAEGAADRAAFGLAPPMCTVSLDLGPEGKGIALRLGRSSPVGTERYAAVDDARVVFTDGTIFGVASRAPEAFRERRLFPVESSSIATIALEGPADRVALTLGDGGCRMTAPLADRASSSGCESLARSLASLELKGPLGAPPPARVRPERRLRIEVDAKGTASPLVAFVAAAGVEGKRLAWREGSTLAGLVDESSLATIDRPADSFRDRAIVSFSAPDVRSVLVDRGGAGLRIERTAEGAPWKGVASGTSVAVDSDRAEALLDALRGLAGASFEPGPPTTKADAMITVSGEHGELARLAYGPLPRPTGSSADFLWVTTPGRPGVVFRLEASGLARVPKDAAGLAAGGAKP